MTIVKYKLKRSKDYLNLTKENLGMIVGILTGNWRLNYHLQKLGYLRGLSSDSVKGNATIHILKQCGCKVS